MTTEACCSVTWNHVSVSIQACVRCTCQSVGSPARLRRSRREGVFGGGLVHQGLHRDAHLHQAFLLQDVVRKTQFVLGDQSQREGGTEETRGKERRGADVEVEKTRQWAQAQDLVTASKGELFCMNGLMNLFYCDFLSSVYTRSAPAQAASRK